MEYSYCSKIDGERWMEKVLFTYLLLSNICALIWAYTNQSILGAKNLHVVRRYLISITVGPFVVIPFWISFARSSMIEARGRRLANTGRKLSKWIEKDQKLYGDDHIEIYNDLARKFDLKYQTFNRLSKRHIAFQNKYVKKMGVWLGKNYI